MGIEFVEGGGVIFGWGGGEGSGGGDVAGGEGRSGGGVLSGRVDGVNGGGSGGGVGGGDEYDGRGGYGAAAAGARCGRRFCILAHLDNIGSTTHTTLPPHDLHNSRILKRRDALQAYVHQPSHLRDVEAVED